MGGKKIIFPDDPAPNAQEWDLRYASVGGTPFTMKDDPPGLFRDLEEASRRPNVEHHSQGTDSASVTIVHSRGLEVWQRV